MMNNISLRLKLHLPSPSCSTPNPPLFVKPSKFAINLRKQTPVPARPITLKHTNTTIVEHDAPRPSLKLSVPENGHSRIVIIGAVYVGILLLLSGIDDQKALALGPEGPLVEEFWDNVRRYALYALTVSTGAIYTIFQPIFELLKNPISAILILAIFGGSIYIVSQVLSAMVGVSDFTYNYGY